MRLMTDVTFQQQNQKHPVVLVSPHLSRMPRSVTEVASKPIVPSCPGQPPPLTNAKVSDGSRFVGSIRTYSCLQGYHDMSTKARIANTTCLGNLTWSRVALKCSASTPTVPSCPGQPPPLTNAKVSDGSRFVGSIRTYSCLQGYHDMSTKARIANTTCLGNLTWSRVALKCSASKPTVPSCPGQPPPLTNAKVSDGSRFVGSIRTYSCLQGYHDMSTKARIANTTCLGNLTWSRVALKCSASKPTVPSCPGQPPPLTNAKVSDGSRFVGSIRTYSCLQGYHDMSTKARIANTTCLGNLTWSRVALKCSASKPTVPSCPGQPPPLTNAKVSDGSRFVGSIRTYSCLQGYHDMSTKARIANTTCLGNLTWSRVALKCSASKPTVPSCPGQPPPLTNAKVSDGSRFVGSIRTYSCLQGYHDMSTKARIANTTCLGNLTWSRVALKCSASRPTVPSCPGQPPPLTNAKVSDGSRFVGGIRTYSCLQGYHDMSTKARIANTTCLGNLTWSRVALKCSASKPTVPSCPGQPPPLTNAKVSDGSRFVGSIRTYSCLQGYHDMSTKARIANTTCLGNLTWSRVALKCSASKPTVPSCPGQPPPLTNAKVSDGSRFVGSIRTYSCLQGYHDMSTKARIANTTCLGNLTWSRVALKCSASKPTVPSCPGQPPPLTNAKVSDGSRFVGSIRTYSCLQGYHDMSTKARIANTTCLGNLTWSRVALKCSASKPTVPSCPGQPPPLTNAKVSDGSRFVGSIRTYSCLQGYHDMSTKARIANTTCLGNLTWSRVALKCSASKPTVPSCPGQPPPLTNAKVSDGSRFVGSIRTYSCLQGYHDMSTKARIANTTCLGNLTWSRVALKCSASKPTVPSCPGQPPPLTNAKVSDGSRFVGSIRTYSCLQGYHDMSTKARIANTTCLGNLTWSRVALKCSASKPTVPSCPGQPPPLTNAKVSDGSRFVGNIRTYSCLQGYHDMSTKARIANTTCLGNLTWSRVALKCSGQYYQKQEKTVQFQLSCP
ncbi:sushi, von Willebrand factor type A, EGF and pentraxin domain-containing protein 1-like [Haliotis asinina]|uniref:sushi, von Willebrand factor type A, EGF and pentraxin domain-containing protein 1-like n=1 Tax=Haliotis asinina TaxID=109174 RepID=UPI0035318DC5